MTSRASILLGLVLLTIGGGEASAAPSSSPSASAPATASDVILYNPSVSVTDPRVRRLVGHDKLASAEGKRILDAVFGGNYLTDQSQCRGVAADLAGARRAGDLVPSVSEAATGSFTTARTTQTLLVIQDGECGASHADNWGSITLAVFNGNTVVARTIVDGGRSIERVVDVDGDGRDEILLTAGAMNQGLIAESAQLAHVDPTGLTVIKDFGQVLYSSCGGGSGPETQTYSIIHAVTKPGAAVEFRLERRTEACAGG